MFKHISRQLIALFLVLLLIFGCIPAASFAAADVSVAASGSTETIFEGEDEEENYYIIDADSDYFGSKMNGGEGYLTAQLNAGKIIPASDSVTFTVSVLASIDYVTLTFDYTAVPSVALIDGELSPSISVVDPVTDKQIFYSDKLTDTVRVSCENEGSFAVTLTGVYSGRTVSGTNPISTSFTLSNIICSPTDFVSASVQGAENGTVTADGETLSGTAAVKSFDELPDTEPIILTAAPASGYSFVGFVDENGTIISPSTPYSYVPYDGAVISAKFVPTSETVYVAGSDENGYQDYDTFEEAVQNAVSGDLIVPMTSAVVPAGSYTLAAGVTLLVPFDDALTVYKTAPGATTGTNATTSVKNLYRKLTFSDGVDLTVSSGASISVSAKHPATDTSPAHNGAVSGKYSQLQLDEGSSVTLEDGAALYAWGFVTGDGHIDALDGSTVYEFFQINDWRGGSATTNFTGGTNQFPFNQYYVQNIEAPLTFHYGAEEQVLMAVYVSSSVVPVFATFIGEDGMFILEDGCTLTRRYDPSTDRMFYSLSGNASIGSIAMDFSMASFDSADYLMPINNIVLTMESGTLTTEMDIIFLPGSGIEVCEGASIEVNKRSDSSGKAAQVVIAGKDIGNYAGNGANSQTPCVPARFSPSRPSTVKRTWANTEPAYIDNNGSIIIGKGAQMISGGQKTYPGLATTSGAMIYSSQGTGTVTVTDGVSSPVLDVFGSDATFSGVKSDIAVLTDDPDDDSSETHSISSFWAQPATIRKVNGVWGDFRTVTLTASTNTNKNTIEITESISRDQLETYIAEHGYDVTALIRDNFVLTGWEAQSSSTSEHAVMKATDVRMYTVTWYDEDKTTILHQESVAQRTNVADLYEAPVKESTIDYDYTFQYWCKANGTRNTNFTVLNNLNLYASYTATPRTYQYYKEKTISLEDPVAYDVRFNLTDEQAENASVKFIYRDKEIDGTLEKYTDGVYRAKLYLAPAEMTCPVNCILTVDGVEETVPNIRMSDYADYVFSNYGGADAAVNTDGSAYYLAGIIHGENCYDGSVKTAYKLSANTDSSNNVIANEYKIENVLLFAGDKVKVCNPHTDAYWYYPDGTGNEKEITETGYYNVFLTTSPNSDSYWHYNHIHVDKLTTADVNAYVRTKSLVSSLMDFAATAQQKFNVNTADLADADKHLKGYTVQHDTAQTDALITAKADAVNNMKQGDTFGGLTYYGTSFTISSEAKLNHYFLINDASLKTQTVTAVINGREVTGTVQGSYMVFSYAGIPGAELGNTLTFTYGGSSGAYSFYTYAKKALATDDTAMHELVRAMYWYNVEAEAYFGLNP